MTTIVTGAAGFIGFHVSRALLKRGERVVGLDNLNAYYDVALKKARLERLKQSSAFSFVRADIADGAELARALEAARGFRRMVHLAAQAGVRYSLENPQAFAQSNLVGHLNILELCRHAEALDHLVYASSSSVYGRGAMIPFSVEQRVDTPVSLYGATKRADELMAHAYSHLFGLPATGLRFFTAYGPWGRPDMAAYKFTRAILAGEPIRVFNNGDMRRDFTYIDDVVDGVLAVLDGSPKAVGEAPPCRVYNIGNSRPEALLDYIAVIERTLGKKAEIKFEPMQPGDLKETSADIGPLRRDFGYSPKVTIEEGVPRFIAWYRDYHGV
jgi:UDP-glucuronate 4-epimerase